MRRDLVILIAFLGLSGCHGGKYRASKVIFEDTYHLENTENTEFVFSKDSTLTVRQRGIYEFGENWEEEPSVRICLDDTARELPEDYNFTEYLLQEADNHMILTYTSEEFNLEANPMILFLLEGEDGLMSGEYFDGTYQIGEDGDSYRYIFQKDGSVTMQVEEYYFADENKLILSDYAGSTEYLYEISDDTFILKNKESETVLTLQKKAEAE